MLEKQNSFRIPKKKRGNYRRGSSDDEFVDP